MPNLPEEHGYVNTPEPHRPNTRASRSPGSDWDVTTFEVGSVAAEVERRIAGFIPHGPWRHRWLDSHGTVRAWVTQVGLESPEAASVTMSVTARFAAWALDHDRPLDAESLLTEDVLQHYVATDYAEYPNNTQATTLSALTRVRIANTRRGTRPSKGRGRTRLQPPYPPQEILDILAAGRRIRDPLRARAHLAITSLVLGAGPMPGETQAVTGRDVNQIGDRVVVTLGLDRRDVPVQPEHAQALLQLAAAHPDETLVGLRPQSRSRMADLCMYARTDLDREPLSMARLRSTWLTEVMLEVPLPEVMRRSGLKTFGHLSDLLPYLHRLHDGQWTRQPQPIERARP